MAHDHAHTHGPGHGHDHGHGHGHGLDPGSRAFAIGIVLNLAFTVIATVYGLLGHSMALLADAVHNLGDVLGLFLAWGATVLAKRRPSQRRTYGLRSSTILAALANAVLLLVMVGGVAWESILRLGNPGHVQGKAMLIVAAVGVFTNGISALMFLRGRKEDVNVRGAFLHLVGDAGTSLGVVIAGAVLLKTGWAWIDPVVSLVVSGIILVGSWSLLRESLDLALLAVPDRVDPEAVRSYLTGLPRVREVHDLHIWGMSTTETALTAHLVVLGDSCSAEFLGVVCRELTERFHIHHPTLQIEFECAPEPCRLAPEDVV